MKTLKDLTVLALDCQATHANPLKGHLLEMGWALTKSSEVLGSKSRKVRTCLLQLPNQEIPRNVSRVTGITPEDLEEASNPAQAWQLLEEDSKKCITTIIHFARFEKPHLQHLCHKVRGTEVLPFRILCTHEIVRRLIPQLPRKGLRAVAGYFGHSIPEMRRSRQHVVATSCIWRQIVRLLGEDLDLHTFEDLLVWLQSESAHTSAGREYPMDSEKRLSLPDTPGVYRMLRSNGDLLYVGKASSLKKRVNSYFQKRSHCAEHLLEMLTQARGIDFTATPTSLEAALLEADEIKRLSPPYNIALRQRERDLVFTSRDFRMLASSSAELHWLGPVPRNVVEPVSQLLALAGSEIDATIEYWDNWPVHAPVTEKPEADCLKQGWELFSQRYASELSAPSRYLLQLGARLWKKRQMEKEAGTADLEGTEEANEQPSWTPEKVCRLLEHRVLVATHWIRKIRWFGLLSNSSVVWSPRRDPECDRVLLVFHTGSIVERKALPPDSMIPVSPGYRISMKERLQQFDDPLLDRFRVLTTELRRIVDEGRDLRVKLRPASTMEPERLSSLLQWV